MFNEANKKQVLEMQAECYADRIGTVYGDFRVIDVWYDWEQRKQFWKLRCEKCGRERITCNGADYRKGRNKGVCSCEAEKLRSEKIAAQQKRAEEAPDNPKWIGQSFGEWTVIEYQSGKGWLVECADCGRRTFHSPTEVKENRAPKCLCAFNYGKYADDEWIGQRYGHLTVVNYSDRYFNCKCDCGRIVKVRPTFLFDGRQNTCGKSDCIHHKSNISTHGLSKSRLYRIWSGMNQRCYNPKSVGYKTYGGRGIGICDEWRNDIHAFVEWSLSHGYSDDLSIDRIDGDKGYSPDNCRWATAKEQANNQQPRYTFTQKPEKFEYKRRTFWTIDGETKSVIDWCEQYGVSVPFVTYRVNKMGMTPYEALTTGKLQKGRTTNAELEQKRINAIVREVLSERDVQITIV